MKTSSILEQLANSLTYLPAKRNISVGTVAPLAAAPPYAAAINVCGLQGFHVPRSASYVGDAMVAQQDAPVIGQGDHIGRC